MADLRPNPALALRLAWGSLRHHRMMAAATVLGGALGMMVVSAILVVDHNTALPPPDRVETENARAAPAVRRQQPAPFIQRVWFIRASQPVSRPALLPTQKGQGASPPPASSKKSSRGAEDYAAMRLAARLASLLAFFVGAVIVFCTMRYAVMARAREFSLLLCLGESRANAALSLAVEAALLGVAGTALGLAAALPAAQALLAMGISTTGQMPVPGFVVPRAELAAMAAISISIALLGVLAPARSLMRLNVAAILQPRFLTTDVDAHGGAAAGFGWLLPPLIAASYLVARPFLISWLSVIQFFLFEAAFVCLLAAATLWWVTPLLRGVIRLTETALRPLMPLEILLAGRRMRLASHRITFSVIGVTLVFGLLTGLHGITRAIKDEIHLWASRAMVPYVYFERAGGKWNEADFQARLRRENLVFFRMSAKLPGDLPVRIIKSADVNPYRAARGRPPLLPGTAVFSTTSAARFGVRPGDLMMVESRGDVHRFRIIEVADDIGFYAENGRYVDLKSYVLVSDGNRLFAGNLATTLGRYGMARAAAGVSRPWRTTRFDALYPYYLRTGFGATKGYWQLREIDRDFLIFDFILFMTMALAGIGVANTMLIQVHARSREFSVLRTVGMDGWQVNKLLLVEGAIIGLVGAALAVVVGTGLGLASVSFLDHFTLFDYAFRFSGKATAVISGLAIATCMAAAIYPALAAARTSSAESLHYE